MMAELIIDSFKMSKFLFRKKYVPGFFMINYNATYAHSFNIRTHVRRPHVGLPVPSLGRQQHGTSATQPAKSRAAARPSN
jgi:hypothetical protein